MTERLKAERNQRPTPQARFAMMWWSDRYSKQRGGSMDFWDALTGAEKQFCHDRVFELFEASRPPVEPCDPVEPNEWVQVKRKGFRLQCCDCGLVHLVDFRLAKDSLKRAHIQFRATRVEV